jgi:hypothetical protein
MALYCQLMQTLILRCSGRNMLAVYELPASHDKPTKRSRTVRSGAAASATSARAMSATPALHLHVIRVEKPHLSMVNELALAVRPHIVLHKLQPLR